MNSSQLYDVVCIGNYTKDTIISPSGTRHVDGGGMNYAAHAAVRLGCKVAVVTRLAKDDERVVQKFIESGIDCYPTYTPQSTEMCLDYPTSNPDIRILSVNGLAGAITVSEVENLAMKSAVISSSLRGEVGLDVIRVLKDKNVFLAADMQGFVRLLQGKSLVYAPWQEMQSTLASLDVLKSDAVEAEYLTGEKDIYKAAEIYADMGPKEIVLTHKDGLLVRADGRNYEMGFYPAQLDGRSGRGDTCVGSYVAMRLSKPAHEAGIWAAAVTSLKMEKLGPFDRPLSDVEFLIHQKYNHGSSS
jgi:sugar/nucleoside kinase (ribokinase family)